MLWGAGTAMGEIPPYAFSYHATRAGQRNEELDSIFEIREVRRGEGLVAAVVMSMKSWMLRFIETCAFPHPDPLEEKNPPVAGCSCLVPSFNRRKQGRGVEGFCSRRGNRGLLPEQAWLCSADSLIVCSVFACQSKVIRAAV